MDYFSLKKYIYQWFLWGQKHAKKEAVRTHLDSENSVKISYTTIAFTLGFHWPVSYLLWLFFFCFSQTKITRVLWMQNGFWIVPSKIIFALKPWAGSSSLVLSTNWFRNQLGKSLITFSKSSICTIARSICTA